jgi:hypothetical protein
VGYESLPNFTKEKNTHKIRGKEATRREDQHSIQRQHPKTQKHPMVVIKKSNGELQMGTNEQPIPKLFTCHMK